MSYIKDEMGRYPSFYHALHGHGLIDAHVLAHVICNMDLTIKPLIGELSEEMAREVTIDLMNEIAEYIDMIPRHSTKSVLRAQWISVTDRVPEEDDVYLVRMDDGFIGTVEWCDGGWELWADAGDVTHWMERPEQPEGV